MSKISVVIPLYNKETVFRNTLNAALNQTFTDFEIIIVNDGSTDNSLEIVKQFKDSRIYIVVQKNKGVSAARNIGIEKASSELIAFLDADDFWYPNHLEELYKLYTTFPNCGMYSSRYVTKIADNKLISNKLIGIPTEFSGIIPDYFQASLVNRVAHTSSVLIPKKTLIKFKGFNTLINNGEDTELWTKIAIRYPVAIHNKVTSVYHFEIPNSLSKKEIKEKKIFDFNQFREDEIQNTSLKKFLDIYRLEYALQYRMTGLVEKSKQLLKKTTTKIPLKTKILLNFPPYFLRLLLKTKHLLKKRGIDFTVYH